MKYVMCSEYVKLRIYLQWQKRTMKETTIFEKKKMKLHWLLINLFKTSFFNTILTPHLFYMMWIYAVIFFKTLPQILRWILSLGNKKRAHKVRFSEDGDCCTYTIQGFAKKRKKNKEMTIKSTDAAEQNSSRNDTDSSWPKCKHLYSCLGV